jgi:hypothetical protein
MNYLPQQNYYYYPAQYQPQFWQALIAGAMDILILIALGAWVFSLMKKAFRGEEVKLQ